MYVCSGFWADPMLYACFSVCPGVGGGVSVALGRVVAGVSHG